MLEKLGLIISILTLSMIYQNKKLKEWKNDLFLGVSLEPEHISAYSLTVEQNTALHSMVKKKHNNAIRRS